MHFSLSFSWKMSSSKDPDKPQDEKKDRDAKKDKDDTADSLSPIAKQVQDQARDASRSSPLNDYQSLLKLQDKVDLQQLLIDREKKARERRARKLKNEAGKKTDHSMKPGSAVQQPVEAAQSSKGDQRDSTKPLITSNREAPELMADDLDSLQKLERAIAAKRAADLDKSSLAKLMQAGNAVAKPSSSTEKESKPRTRKQQKQRVLYENPGLNLTEEQPCAKDPESAAEEQADAKSIEEAATTEMKTPTPEDQQSVYEEAVGSQDDLSTLNQAIDSSALKTPEKQSLLSARPQLTADSLVLLGRQLSMPSEEDVEPESQQLVSSRGSAPETVSLSCSNFYEQVMGIEDRTEQTLSEVRELLEQLKSMETAAVEGDTGAASSTGNALVSTAVVAQDSRDEVKDIQSPADDVKDDNAAGVGSDDEAWVVME